MPSPDLTLDLDVGVTALAASPFRIWPPSGVVQEPSKFLGYVEVATVITYTTPSVFCALLFPSSLATLPGLSFEILLRKEQHPQLHPFHTSVSKPVFTSVISSDLVNSWG